MIRSTRQVLKERREIRKMKNENPPDISGTFEAFNSIKLFGRVDKLYQALGTDIPTYDINKPVVVERAEFYAKQKGIFVELNTYLGSSKDDPNFSLSPPLNTLQEDPRLNQIGIWENAGRMGSGTEWVLHLANYEPDNGRWTIRPTKVNDDNMVEEIEAIYVESGKDPIRVTDVNGLPGTVLPNQTQYPCLAHAKAKRKKHNHDEHEHEDHEHEDHDHGNGY